MNETFKKELEPILEMLQSSDKETKYLGYNLLRDTKFKKYMRGKVWTENCLSFYRFNLYKLKDINKYKADYKESLEKANYSFSPVIKIDRSCLINHHNENKIAFASKVITLYINDKIKITELHGRYR